MMRFTCARVSRVLSIIGLSVAAAACGGGGTTGDDVPPGDDTGGACELSPMGNGVSTLTGCDDAGMVDGGRGDALFSNPVNLAVANDGKIYVADFDNSRIRVVSADGTTTTLTAQEGFSRPFGITFAPDGTLYVQTDNNPQNQHSTTTGTVWRVNTSSGAATVIAQDLGRPRGMVALADGRLVIADHMHHVVRLLNPATGATSLLAGTLDVPGFADGTGAAARFRQPYGVVDLGDGSVAVADYENHRIRKVTLTGEVTTIAGAGSAGDTDGPAASAQFAFPQDLAIDGAGTIYVSDTENFLIRRLRAGTVDTVAGNGSGTYADSDDPRGAGIFGLEGFDIGNDGALYIADGNRGEVQPHNRIRRAVVQ
jgi:sugar lactone lactonase YvrE